MSFKYIKINFTLFIFSYFLIIIILSTLSYNFFIRNFNDLENQHNKTNIQTFLSSVQQTFISIEKTALDYANWNETYDFIKGINRNKYIEDNFPENSNTLEYLDIDYILYTALDSTIVFEEKHSKLDIQNPQALHNNLIQTFQRRDKISTFYNYENSIFYLIKTTISNSQLNAVPNGYIYILKKFDLQHLNQMNTIFKSITLNIDTTSIKKEFNNTTPYFYYAIFNPELKNELIQSSIYLFNNQDQYSFTLTTQNSATIIEKGKSIIVIYNVILAIFILLMMLVIYINHRKLSMHHNLLESRVKQRTQQVTNSLRKLQQQNVDLYNLAHKDYLTNINNRRNYFILSEKALANAVQNNLPFSVLIIDIDHFKSINDKYGHAIGDVVLIKFCDIVNAIIDKDAIFGRIGGEEFCISFKNKTLDEAYSIAEKIRTACEQTTVKEEDITLNFTVSLGLSDSTQSHNIDELLQYADELLYDAKSSGRNRAIRKHT